MIKLLIGFIIGYVVVSVYGPSIIFDFWDGVVNTVEAFKEVKTQWKI